MVARQRWERDARNCSSPNEHAPHCHTAKVVQCYSTILLQCHSTTLLRGQDKIRLHRLLWCSSIWSCPLIESVVALQCKLVPLALGILVLSLVPTLVPAANQHPMPLPICQLNNQLNNQQSAKHQSAKQSTVAQSAKQSYPRPSVALAESTHPCFPPAQN